MILPREARKACLTLHIASSAGWFGVVLMYLALAIAAVSSDDSTLVAAAYVAMGWAGWFVLVPLALTSLLSGVLQALATSWGLSRHYWVVAKLALTLIATAVLLIYTRTLSAYAEIASKDPIGEGDLASLRNPTVVLHSSAAIVVLLLATALAVYKPAGMTRRGQRLQHRAVLARAESAKPVGPAS